MKQARPPSHLERAKSTLGQRRLAAEWWSPARMFNGREREEEGTLKEEREFGGGMIESTGRGEARAQGRPRGSGGCTCILGGVLPLSDTPTGRVMRTVPTVLLLKAPQHPTRLGPHV